MSPDSMADGRSTRPRAESGQGPQAGSTEERIPSFPKRRRATKGTADPAVVRAVRFFEIVRRIAAQEGRPLAIHSLDLNNFKQANDRFGHPVGDAVLREVAKRLRELTRQTDLLVRLGGDEFLLVQTDVESREHTLALAARIIKEIATTYYINGNAIQLGTSVGIAIMTSGQSLTADELLDRADQALYQAKRAGGGFAVYAAAPQLVPTLPEDDSTGAARRIVNSN